MIRVFLAACLIAAALISPGSAHHTYAMFDRDKTVALTGEVKAFTMTNPHSWLQIAVPAADATQIWFLEMGPPGALKRQGWTADSVQAGESVNIRFHPMKDGSHGGQLMSVEVTGGKRLSAGGGLD